LGLVTDKTKNNKLRVEHEPRSAHGRAVNKPRVEHEPHSAHGRAVNKRILNLAIVFKFTSVFSCLKHFALISNVKWVDSTQSKVAHLDLSIVHHPYFEQLMIHSIRRL